MAEKIIQSIRGGIKHWYLLAILGLIMCLVGVWVFFTPVKAYVALSIFFALTFLISGLLEIFYAIANKDTSHQWGWELALGIFEFLMGILLISNLEMSMQFLPLYVGFTILFRSVTVIGSAFYLRKLDKNNWGWVLFSGIISLAFAFILLWNPFVTGIAIAMYTGLAFVFVGISQIILSFRLRKVKNFFTDLKS